MYFNSKLFLIGEKGQSLQRRKSSFFLQNYCTGQQGYVTAKLNNKGKPGQARNRITISWSLAQLMVGSGRRRDQHPLAADA